MTLNKVQVVSCLLIREAAMKGGMKSRSLPVAGLESFYFGLVTSEVKERAAKPQVNKWIDKAIKCQA